MGPVGCFCQIENIKRQSLSMPRYRSWDLSRFFCRVVSFVIEFLNLIKERISRASASGCIICPSVALLSGKQQASCCLPHLSCAASRCSRSAHQQGSPQCCVFPIPSICRVSRTRRSPLHIRSSTPRPDISSSRSCAVLPDLHPGCTSSRLTSPTILSPTNSSNGHPILCRCYVL